MSDALKLLQEKCGCTADGSFGPNTARGIVSHYELSPERGAHLLGQVIHESGTFRYVRENLNYSVEAMMKVWPSRFPTEESAEPFARNPKALAENVYLGRMGNDSKEKASRLGLDSTAGTDCSQTCPNLCPSPRFAGCRKGTSTTATLPTCSFNCLGKSSRNHRKEST